MSSAGRHVLIVEDDFNSAGLFQRVLEKVDPECPVTILRDGSEAIRYLSERLGADPRPLPSVIVTDLKMPKVNGFEVLSWVRRQSTLADLPIAVLTSSSEQVDIDRARSLGATAYFEKPLCLDDLLKIARDVLSLKGHVRSSNSSPDAAKTPE